MIRPTPKLSARAESTPRTVISGNDQACAPASRAIFGIQTQAECRLDRFSGIGDDTRFRTRPRHCPADRQGMWIALADRRRFAGSQAIFFPRVRKGPAGTWQSYI